MGQLDKSADPASGAHPLKMWTPCKFTIDQDYDYLRDSAFHTAVHKTVRAAAHGILNLYNRLAFGLRVCGKENIAALKESGAVTVCNHVHMMDCTMLDCAFRQKRVYYATLQSNFKIPVVRRLIRVLGGVPISADPRQIRRMFCSMGTALRRGCFVHIYPEGILYPYYQKGMRNFHSGAFHLAVSSRMPIVPAVITFHKRKGLWALKRKPCVRLTFLPPIYPDLAAGKTEEIQRLTMECRRQMEEAFQALTESF